jgi:hypothetical protein
MWPKGNPTAGAIRPHSHAKRSVGEVRQRRAECRRGDDGRPIENRMEALRENLRCDEHHERDAEQRGSG